MKSPAPAKITHQISIRVFDPPSRRGQGRLKILLLKTDHIGDFVTALEAFRLLRQAFAGAEITLICLSSVVELAQSTGLFDKVKGFADVPDSAQIGKTPQTAREEKIAQFKALLEEPYFLAADFKHDPFDRWALDHVETRYRAAFMAYMEKKLDIVIPTMEWDVPSAEVKNGGNLPVHAGVRLTLLAHAIIETLKGTPRHADLFHAGPAVLEAGLYRGLQSVQGMKVGVSVGAGAEVRKWETTHWAAFLQRLAQERKAHIVFFGGESDKAETQLLASRLPPQAVTDLTGEIPLAQAPFYMGLLQAYIGCDTGLTHLAASLDLPTVNIYAGISNISVWRARGEKVKTVYAETICAPCHLRFKAECPNNNVCMAVLAPDIVYACFEQVLAL